MTTMSQAVTPEIMEIVARALREDIGDGDITTESTVAPDLWLTGRFVSKAEGVIAGLDIAEFVFNMLDERCMMTKIVNDGNQVYGRRETIASIEGPARALLTGERTALNILQRMSGIATAAHQFVTALNGTHAKILDTRKTAPGLRTLDKLAFKIGGGTNHRIGLYDMVMIKNNHVAACGGSIAKAVELVRIHDIKHRPIEVEVRNFGELNDALAQQVDRIMLDNMTLEDMTSAVALVAGRVPLEASGNVTLEKVRAIATTGVDFISTGSVTHSVQALDISLWLDEPGANC